MTDLIVPPLKRCSKCKEEKSVSFFSRDKQKSDGLRSWCKLCDSQNHKDRPQESKDRAVKASGEWAKRNRKKLNERAKARYPQQKKYRQEWVKRNRDKCRAADRKWRAAHLEEARAADRAYARENREKRAEYNDTWRKNNPDKMKATRKRSRLKNAAKFALLHKIWRESPRGKLFKMLSGQKRRALIKGLPHNYSAAQWLASLDYFNHRCAVCDRPRGLWHELVQDHWIAIADPRPDNPGAVPWNIVPLCHGIDGCNNKKRNVPAKEWLTNEFGAKKARGIMEKIEKYFEWSKR